MPRRVSPNKLAWGAKRRTVSRSCPSYSMRYAYLYTTLDANTCCELGSPCFIPQTRRRAATGARRQPVPLAHRGGQCYPTAVGVAWAVNARNGAAGAFPGAARKQPALAASRAATARCRRRRRRLYLQGQLRLRTPQTTFRAEVNSLPLPLTRRVHLCVSRAAPGSGWSRTPATLAAPTKPPLHRTWRS